MVELSRLKSGFFTHIDYKLNTSDTPIRADIYGKDALKEHARKMGHSDRVQTNLRSAYPLPKRLWENQQRLTFIHKKFSESQAADKTILPPSAEWLVENFYLVPLAKKEKLYIFSILKICKKEKIDIVLPLTIEELVVLLKNIKIFNFFPPLEGFNQI